MNCKVLEIRDDGTFISALAIQMLADNPVAGWYIHAREGHPVNVPSVTLMRLGDKKASNDPFEWGDRTLQTAHLYICEHFDSLNDGDVVDVEFILGERETAKVKGRHEKEKDWKKTWELYHNPPKMPESLRLREGDQPLPVPNDLPDIQSMVITDILARRELGITRYGSPLKPHNGRDALRDLYEELIDGAMYAKQAMVERDGVPVGEL